LNELSEESFTNRLFIVTVSIVKIMGSFSKTSVFMLILFLLTCQIAVHSGSAQVTSPEPTPTLEPTPMLIWQFNPGNASNPANQYTAVQWSSAAILDGVVYVGMSGTHSYNVTRIIHTDTVPQYANFTETVYEGWGGVYALNASTGEQIWSYIGDDCKASPTAFDGKVYAQTGSNQLSALNISNGQNLWTFSVDIGVGKSPTFADDKIYIGWLNGNVYALYANSGFVLWKFTLDPSNLFYPVYDMGNDVSAPIVANGTVYVSSFNGNLYALNATIGTKIWSYDAKGPISLSPAVFNGRVYFGTCDGNVYALNATDGERIWNYTTGALLSSLTVANNVVFVNSGWWTNGSTSVLNNIYALNALSGDKLWNSIVGTANRIIGFGGSLTVIDDLVFFSSSSDNNLYSFNASTGTKISVYPAEGVIFSSPLVVNDAILYFSSKDGVVYASRLPYIPPYSSNPITTANQTSEFLIIGLVALAIAISVSLLFYRRYQKKLN